MTEPITASITFDEPTMLTGFHWYNCAHRTAARVRSALFFVAGLLMFFGLMLSSTKSTKEGISVMQALYVVVPAIAITVAASFLRRFLERRQFLASVKSSPLFGKTVVYKVVGDQVEVTSPHSQGTLSWQFFSRTVETLDGLLLFQNKRVFNWLPKTAFTTDSGYQRFRDLAAANTQHSKIS